MMDAEPLCVPERNVPEQIPRDDDALSTPMTAKVKEFMQLITVEPTMFLYMLAFMLTSVVEQAFFVNKACLVDLNYNASICKHLDDFEEEKKKVQVVVSTFHQWNDVAGQIIPICLALFVGAWSDRRGRKLLLILGLVGKLWYSVWVVINATQSHWPLDVVIWSAILPSGLTGADLSIFAACFSYICDVSSEANRTLRVTVLDVTYLVSIPVGVALGNYLFYSVVDQSYAIMFSLNAFLLLCSLVYSIVRLEWTTTPRQERLTLSGCCGCSSDSANANCLVDFFDKDHLVQSVRTLFKKRPFHGRLYIVILIFSLALYTFQRDERSMSYLYTNLVFKWNVSDFSHFRTFQSAFYVLGTTVCLPLMSRWLRFSDTTMIMIGTAAHAAARVIFALAQDPWLFYLGSAISSLGPVVAPVIRSMASKIAPLEERGKVFAVLSVADTAVPLFSGTVYSQVYNATIKTDPSAIFWVTVATQLSVFCAALVIRYLSHNRPLEECSRSFSSEGSSEVTR